MVAKIVLAKGRSRSLCCWMIFAHTFDFVDMLAHCGLFKYISDMMDGW